MLWDERNLGGAVNLMKIRIAKSFLTPKGHLLKGSIIEVTPTVAERWVENGEAEYYTENKLNASPENQMITPAETQMVKKPRKRRKVKHDTKRS